MPDVPTINLCHGCVHDCVYCYARSYSQYPGRGRVAIYENLVDRLSDELARRRRRPVTVCFSSASDAFQGVPEVLDLAYRTMDLLMRWGVRVSILTKGLIPAPHMDLLAAHPRRATASVGLLTLNARVASALEPRAAPPRLRIEQAARLIERGVPTALRADPIIPGATDDEVTLDELLSAAAGAGVRYMSASVLFLRRPIADAIHDGIRDQVLRRAILERYRQRIPLPIHAERFVAWALPRHERQAIFNRLRRIASRHGIEVHTCGCKNPDLPFDDCSVNRGLDLPVVCRARQLELFAS